jgi:sec-independent protein translocase protein TatB
MLVIGVVAMVVLGPEKLPQAMRQAGKLVAEVRRWSSVLSIELQDVVSLDTEAKPPPAVAPSPSTPNGNTTGDPSSAVPFRTAVAPWVPSVPSPLSPGGEWSDSTTEEASSGSTLDNNAGAPALREGGEWSDPR